MRVWADIDGRMVGEGDYTAMDFADRVMEFTKRAEQMVTCCEQERTTNFCPDCGADLEKGVPIYDLQKYLRSRVRQYAALQTKLSAATTPDEAEDAEEANRNYDKWNGWATALAELIAQTEK